MAEQVEYNEVDLIEGQFQSEHKKYVSQRGPFEINANPTINPPIARQRIKTERSAEGLEHADLAQQFGETETAEKIGEMVKAFIPGTSTTPLISQKGPNGMSLVHVWFGANFPLFRHSHPAYGDCLYYVIAGEITMGKRVLGAGSTFFVPNGQPYKYTAGPAGVELLEFRAGGGEHDAPGTKLGERSLDAMQKIIEGANANEHLWQAPVRMGEVALKQAEIDQARSQQLV